MGVAPPCPQRRDALSGVESHRMRLLTNLKVYIPSQKILQKKLTLWTKLGAELNSAPTRWQTWWFILHFNPKKSFQKSWLCGIFLLNLDSTKRNPTKKKIVGLRYSGVEKEEATLSLRGGHLTDEAIRLTWVKRLLRPLRGLAMTDRIANANTEKRGTKWEKP